MSWHWHQQNTELVTLLSQVFDVSIDQAALLSRDRTPILDRSYPMPIVWQHRSVEAMEFIATHRIPLPTADADRGFSWLPDFFSFVKRSRHHVLGSVVAFRAARRGLLRLRHAEIRGRRRDPRRRPEFGSVQTDPHLGGRQLRRQRLRGQPNGDPALAWHHGAGRPQHEPERRSGLPVVRRRADRVRDAVRCLVRTRGAACHRGPAGGAHHPGGKPPGGRAAGSG